jgi:excisionase family DNA binding protein
VRDFHGEGDAALLAFVKHIADLVSFLDQNNLGKPVDELTPGENAKEEAKQIYQAARRPEKHNAIVDRLKRIQQNAEIGPDLRATEKWLRFGNNVFGYLRRGLIAEILAGPCPGCGEALPPENWGGLCRNCKTGHNLMTGLCNAFKASRQPQLYSPLVFAQYQDPLKSMPEWLKIQHLACEWFGHSDFTEQTMERLIGWLQAECGKNSLEAVMNTRQDEVTALLRNAVDRKRGHEKERTDGPSHFPKLTNAIAPIGPLPVDLLSAFNAAALCITNTDGIYRLLTSLDPLSDPTSTMSAVLSQADQDYTVRDLAGRTQSSSRHIWRLIDKGLVPGVYRLGRLVRIHRATADAWLAAGCKSIRQAGRASS